MASTPSQHTSADFIASYETTVGRFAVKRLMPRRARRMVGAWCFADHFGPADVTPEASLDVGPHPHTGLQTFTWLIEGQALHKDSLGSEQVLRAGQLNVMTAGYGITHAEESTGHYRGTLMGTQLWIAQRSAHRNGPAGFAHHSALPGVTLQNGEATVLIGSLGAVTSPATNDEDVLGVHLELAGTTSLPLRTTFEHGVIVVRGAVRLDGRELTTGTLAYLAPGRDELSLTASGRATVLLLGGEPFDETIMMWWNFVVRNRDELREAITSWNSHDDRFGKVVSALTPYDAPPLL